MARAPIGVIALGVYAFVTGVAQAFIGFLLMGVVVFGPVPTGEGVALVGLFAVITGAIYLVVGIGAWTLKPWAYGFGLFMSAFGLLNAFLVLIATGSLAYGAATALFPFVVFWYLQRKETQDAFVAAATARAEQEQGR